jgi:hypothetical protein
MLARVVCCKCHKNLNIKKIIEKDSMKIIIVESCSATGCCNKSGECNIEDYERYLDEMLQIIPTSDVSVEMGL